jgi:transposase
VNLLEEPSIRYLYQRRIEQHLSHSSISLNINIEREALKSILTKATTEALGKRKKRKHKRGLHIWNEEIANLIKNKKEAYLRYLN